MQNDRVHKKLKLTSEKEKELDLENIMDDSDTLPDIVLNQPGTSVTHADTKNTSDLESPSNQSTSRTSDVIISENELSGVTTPPMGMNMPNNIETAAVTAAIENIMDYRLFCGGTDNTNNDSLTNLSESGEHVPDINENGNTDTEPNKLIGNVVNEPDTERLSSNATDNHNTRMPTLLSAGEPTQDVNKTSEGDTNLQNDTLPDTTLNSTIETVKTDEPSELNDKLHGVTESGIGVTPFVNPVLDTKLNRRTYGHRCEQCAE